MADQPERIPMGIMGMNPAAMHAISKSPAPARPDPGMPRMAEQAALVQRQGIGSVPPRKRGGRI